MTKEEIRKRLPQREPMLMVDDAWVEQPGERVLGYKKISTDEIWTQGHFPGDPVFPGVLLIEHMAQVTLFLMDEKKWENGARPYLAKVDQVKFLQPVYPEMELYTEVKKATAGAGFLKAEAFVYIDHERTQMAAKGKLTCYLGQDGES